MRSNTAQGILLHGIDLEEVAAWARGYERVTLDLGTGDGRFARELAGRCPVEGVIGVDTAGANLREAIRRSPENARFLVGDALALPEPLVELADQVTINFPWGSLLRALLEGDERLLPVLAGRECVILVNAGAMAEAGYRFENGIEALLRTLRRGHPRGLRWREIERDELRRIPTTWAKRLAFGRDPRAVEVVVR
jgi:SAM-dependent methyltransferase